MSNSNTQPVSDRNDNSNNKYKSSIFDSRLSPLLNRESTSNSFKLPNSQNLDNTIDDVGSSYNELAKTLDTNFIKMKLVKLEELLGKADKALIKHNYYIEIISQLESMIDYMNQDRIKQQNLGIKLEHLMENQILYLTRYFEDNNFERFDSRIGQLEQKVDGLTILLNQNFSNIDPTRVNQCSTFSNLNNPRWPSVGASMVNSDINNINRSSETLDYKLRELKRSYPEIPKLSSIYEFRDEYPNFRKSEALKLMTEPPKLFNPQTLNETYPSTEDSSAIKAQPKKRGRRKLSEKK
ncbi:hypothetical protein CONCODRAFT_69723 [Conidiobolus coronatus NRRL 28638]|uniref:Uncharacterized protein n=1 Tax=Conidiobolus coronatus (strain ATCC 28846 / CBS 209.66 / NRRL 28638) TaxID=796925 RepID=A0A137P964_CONC2|nr:hypothetical protein CONCODRAFT_69723 [Conidiobolus coronatus NRRL 28638]|eukprot:KXN71557.1 hypothetical protein CONCODRAFT_69723 [Conidiobolus coronatus NRRL 28638]